MQSLLSLENIFPTTQKIVETRKLLGPSLPSFSPHQFQKCPPSYKEITSVAPYATACLPVPKPDPAWLSRCSLTTSRVSYARRSTLP
uniref:Uncharacterized protein n=1 Tax=Triticum urartu TaxID=4572 RepID=A0A8R7P2H0_TRIUA